MATRRETAQDRTARAAALLGAAAVGESREALFARMAAALRVLDPRNENGPGPDPRKGGRS